MFTVRPGTRDDYAFVIDSWLTSHEHSTVGQDARGVYYQRQKALIRAILARESTALRLAHAPGEPDAFLGWSCTAPTAKRVYYVYVKRDARQLGIATSLLEGFDAPVTFCAKPVVRGLSVPRGWTYDPYANHDA